VARIDAAALDALDDPLLVLDGSGTLVGWNDALVELTGYDEPALSGRPLAGLFPDDDADRVTATLAGDAGDSVEAALRTATGERLAYEFEFHRLPADAGSGSHVALGRRISARATGDERRENHEQVLRRMYEIIADRNRPFQEQVEALLALGRTELDTDYGTLSEIDGDRYVFEIVDAADDSVQAGDVVELSATNCELAAANRETLVLGDVARDAPEQTDRAGYTEMGIACYIGAPVFDEDGVYGTFCFYDTEPMDGQFSDWEVTLVDLMSRWVSYEIQRQAAQDRLAEQNERLERFASVVSHDLRNPLGVLAGSIELAQETGDLEQLTRAQDAVDRMQTLIDDLLTLSRAGTVIGEREPVELASLTDQCWANVTTADASVRVDTDRTVVADPTRLRQLVENLLRNSVEHGGGRVTVTVGDLDEGFYVADDGPGVPESERDAVFESGYTTAEEGTGFGLAIVGEIADAHGWELALAESADGGARFEISGVEPPSAVDPDG